MVEYAVGRRLEGAAPAADDVAHEFKIDIRSRTPPVPQSALEKVQERMGMAVHPIRILRNVPGVVEFAGRRRRVRIGAREIEREQAFARVSCDARTIAEIVRVEERVGTISELLADERVMRRSERRRKFAHEAPPRV